MTDKPEKFERVAADLDDLALDVDELEDISKGKEATKIDKVKQAIEKARDAIDEIAEDD